MRLDGVRVKAVLDVSGLPRMVPGMSVLVPADEADPFTAGSIHRLSEPVTRESYEVMIVQRHETSVGVCCFLKKWEAN